MDSPPPAPSLPAQRLLGKTVLITGAGGTIGLETAKRMLQEGANLGLVDIDGQALDRAMDKLRVLLVSRREETTGELRLLPLRADCTDEAAVEAYTVQTFLAFGRLDCVFLTVGMSGGSMSIFDATVEDYEKLMRINVKSG